MTAAALAQLLDARPSGRGKWQARCPAHDDRSPSLSVREGDNGKTLIRCWAGCATADVLRAAGLTWADLFAGPPPSAEEQVAVRRDREESDAVRRQLRQLHRDGCDRFRALQQVVDSLAPRLMRMPDSAEVEMLTAVYHDALDEVGRLESVLMRMERCWL
jgi:hypothetical protein